jgi:hypothetical protein
MPQTLNGDAESHMTTLCQWNGHMCSESTRDRSNLHLFVSILKPFVEIDDNYFCEMRLWKSDKMLVLQNVDGVNYMHVKQAGLLFVATTRVNLSPALVLELLQRIARVTKDYLGVLNEDSLRKNFVLVYELLDEMIVSYFPNPCVHYCPSYSQSNCDRLLQF